ncbi:hypothetical protein GALMADRAFT_222853 [Galerina marginata CBS 339.88]|uniref:F-box domain-containing protein n=1 Tax=Galerina marginata (strain CBS 339.88) TaxID=685588 RepID=A0A067TLU9_GALM3|nr:hypothetical protein GALMADRAFT_222853 [Galerina marginata CBS 339.88]
MHRQGRPPKRNRFPPDITARIIDVLGEGLLDLANLDCLKALAKCLLVSRTFCHHSRRHLFRSVRLKDSPQKTFFDRVALLREIIAPRSNPHSGIISYIKVFRVDISRQPGPTLYTKKDEGLAIILEAFLLFGSRLEEFNFVGLGVDWHKLGRTVQERLCSIIRTPSLSVIHLAGLDGVPTSILTGITCKKLSLCRLKTDNILHEAASNLEWANIPQLRLEYFNTDNTFPLKYVSSNGPWTDLPNNPTSPFACLKKLALKINSQQHHQESLKVLLGVKSSLQEMEIVLTSNGITAAIDIGQFPRLQKLRLQQQNIDISYIFFPAVIRILNPATPCISLKQLDLRFTSHYSYSPTACTPLHRMTVWPRIDAFLSTPQFPSLNRVRLLLDFGISSGHRRPLASTDLLLNEVPRLRESFPMLSYSDSVEFTVEICGG